MENNNQGIVNKASAKLNEELNKSSAFLNDKINQVTRLMFGSFDSGEKGK